MEPIGCRVVRSRTVAALVAVGLLASQDAAADGMPWQRMPDRRHTKVCDDARPRPHERAVLPCLLLERSLGPPPAGLCGSATLHTQRRAPRPNVVLIVTDDQRWDTLEQMPNVMDRLVDEGVRFTNGFVPTPLCGPSRASLLTGRYAHSTGVTDNGLAGFDATHTIATSLREAGYATAMIGKYLNGTETNGAAVQPGWDRWGVFVRGGYVDYVLNDDGALVVRGDEEGDYSTDVLGDMAVEFIVEHAHRRPFFLLFAPFAPHGSPGGLPLAAARHAGRRSGVPPLRPIAYHEQDVSDKPLYVRWVKFVRQNAFLPAWVARMDAYRIASLETLLAVDDAVASILDTLDALSLADDTLVIFTSDNGFSLGEHWLYWKGNPYDESVRVPLVMRYPRWIDSSREDDRLVLNLDLAPTIAELAGARLATAPDGESLVSLVCDDASGREDFLVEYLIPLSLDGMPSYTGVRSKDWSYVRYESDDPRAQRRFDELYDLASDTGQLDNVLRVAPDDPAVQATRARLEERRLELLAGPD